MKIMRLIKNIIEYFKISLKYFKRMDERIVDYVLERPSKINDEMIVLVNNKRMRIKCIGVLNNFTTEWQLMGTEKKDFKYMALNEYIDLHIKEDKS